MPIHLRHQPNMDLRSAAMTSNRVKDSDTYSFDSQSSESGYETAYERHPHMKQRNLRLATSTPMLQNRYQSDEEQLSPTTEESTNHSQEEDLDLEDDSDFDDVEVISAFEIASKIEIAYVGRPALITVSALAPMYKRQTSAARPAKISHASSANAVPKAIPRRSSLRNKQANRSVSMYEPPVLTEDRQPPSTLVAHPPMNFSTPSRHFSPRPSPLGSSSPPQLVEPGSPSSSYPDSDTNSSIDEAEALMREAEEIQIRTHSMERERQNAFGGHEDDIIGKPPTPTSYDAYDPFALSPPTLNKSKTVEPLQQETKKWKGLGIGRKVRIGRKAREAEVGF